MDVRVAVLTSERDLRATRHAGPVVLTATAPGMKPVNLRMQTAQ